MKFTKKKKEKYFILEYYYLEMNNGWHLRKLKHLKSYVDKNWVFSILHEKIQIYTLLWS